MLTDEQIDNLADKFITEVGVPKDRYLTIGYSSIPLYYIKDFARAVEQAVIEQIKNKENA